ncbi:hypothetical protein [Pseudonocardia sp. H11422]|uniref:hypothetical protein n=1 Tax=Pseudonocardia sp. H11422 TaxID=2835866 RepID=UPI001BDBEE7A|nr:hypothetical protein [Pseudonocardia sp. H11422]
MSDATITDADRGYSPESIRRQRGDDTSSRSQDVLPLEQAAEVTVDQPVLCVAD